MQVQVLSGAPVECLDTHYACWGAFVFWVFSRVKMLICITQTTFLPRERARQNIRFESGACIQGFAPAAPNRKFSAVPEWDGVFAVYTRFTISQETDRKKRKISCDITAVRQLLSLVPKTISTHYSPLFFPQPERIWKSAVYPPWYRSINRF